MWSSLLDKGRQELIIWPAVKVANSRGSVEWAPDTENPIRLRVTTTGDRSQIADLTGQVDVEVMRVKTRTYPGRLGGTWSRVLLDGVEYDLAEPPRYTKGPSRALSHWTFTLRSRANLSPIEDLGPIEEIALIERRSS